MKYTVMMKKGNESGYVAYAPDLKGCVSQGKTKTEALKNPKGRVPRVLHVGECKSRLSEIVMLEFAKGERSIWWGAFSDSLVKRSLT